MTVEAIDVTPTEAAVDLRAVVAVAVRWRGRVGLFRRSAAVHHDQGRWHCITGYIDPGGTPLHQALLELHEETGLGVADLESFRAGNILELKDRQGFVWTVYTFSAISARRRLRLNEEHDAYRWVHPTAVARFSNRVDWLGLALAAAGVPHCIPAPAD